MANPVKQSTINSARLNLRPFQWSDKSSVENLIADPALTEQTNKLLHPFTNQQVSSWLMSHESMFKQRLKASWAITLRDNSPPIGCITLTFSNDSNSAEVGYWLGTDYWQRGYATEACNTVVQHAMDDLSVNRIFAFVLPGNTASFRVLEKCGLVVEGTSKSIFFFNNRYQDATLLARVSGNKPHPDAPQNALDVLPLGHPQLLQTASAVEPGTIATPEFQQLVDQLIDTLRQFDCMELSAVQLGQPLQLLAIEVSNTLYQPYREELPLIIAINPTLEILSDNFFNYYDSCISVPGMVANVQRPAEIQLSALDRHGEPFTLTISGISAALIHHAWEHLQGRLFTDHLTDISALISQRYFHQYIEADYRFSMLQLKRRYRQPLVAGDPA